MKLESVTCSPAELRLQKQETAACKMAFHRPLGNSSSQRRNCFRRFVRKRFRLKDSSTIFKIQAPQNIYRNRFLLIFVYVTSPIAAPRKRLGHELPLLLVVLVEITKRVNTDARMVRGAKACSGDRNRSLSCQTLGFLMCPGYRVECRKSFSMPCSQLS